VVAVPAGLTVPAVLTVPPGLITVGTLLPVRSVTVAVVFPVSLHQD